MASGLVRSALSYILTDDPTFAGTSKRCQKCLEQVTTLLDRITEDKYCDLFHDFSSQLLIHLQSLLQKGSSTVKREELWSIFHQKRTNGITRIWKTFLQSIQLDLDPLVYQSVTQLLYKDNIRTQFASGHTATTKKSACISLTHEEECIIRYAAGYVPFALLKKYEKSSLGSAVQCIECLTNIWQYVEKRLIF